MWVVDRVIQIIKSYRKFISVKYAFRNLWSKQLIPLFACIACTGNFNCNFNFVIVLHRYRGQILTKLLNEHFIEIIISHAFRLSAYYTSACIIIIIITTTLWTIALSF